MCWAQKHQSVVFLHMENPVSIQKTRKLQPTLRKKWENAPSHPHLYSDKHNTGIAPQPGRERLLQKTPRKSKKIFMATLLL